jgi:pimeloyl-ACP methyl ester carboxylesterase
MDVIDRRASVAQEFQYFLQDLQKTGKRRFKVNKNIIRRGFVDTPQGQIHYATAGQGKPILLLHQTPRSWTEYLYVLPVFAEKYRAIAMDTVGFGDSYKLAGEETIEEYARGVIAFLAAMSIPKTSIVGHHTGGVIAVEVAATYPEVLEKLVLSSTPYVDAKDREDRKNRPPIDHVEEKKDGSHLSELWRKRMAFYGDNESDLLTNFVIDALKVGRKMEEGHRAVNRYRMEDKVSLIKAPTLVVTGSRDPVGPLGMESLARSIKGSRTAVIDGGTVPMVEQRPEEFARIVMNFLEEK